MKQCSVGVQKIKDKKGCENNNVGVVIIYLSEFLVRRIHLKLVQFATNEVNMTSQVAVELLRYMLNVQLL